MRRFRTVTVVTLIALLFGLTGVVYADDGDIEPASINSFAFAPDTITQTAGEQTDASVDVDAASGTTIVALCFYFSDVNFNNTSVWPNSVTGSRATSYTRAYLGADGGAPSCPVYGSGYVAEYSGTPSTFAKLLGEGVDVTLTLAAPLPAKMTHTFDLLQLEDGVATSGDSADLTIADPPGNVYVSNTPGCGGNSPCYTGSDALQSAFDAIADGGTVNVYGTLSEGGIYSATLNSVDNKSVTLTGFNSPRIENGGGDCSTGGPMIANEGTGTLTVTALTIDGTCGTGSRSAGILNAGSGTTVVKDNANTIRDFTGPASAGVRVTNGTMVVAGNTFANNNVAMDASGGGNLYAFANNVVSNTGSDAATFADTGGYNVRCNYWGGATISGFATDYAERLGAPVNSYVEGSGSLTLGNAALGTAGVGNSQVLINLGRDTDNPPFNNGTTSGLGALVSDFYASCSSRSNVSNFGAMTITGDAVSPGPNGFRLYEIDSAANCSPSDNDACWDHAATGSATCSSIGCAVTDGTPSEGHFVVGNEVDPTAIVFTNVAASSNPWLSVGLVVGVSVLAMGVLVVLRKRA